MEKLEGRVAVVTGAASGIGLGIARALASRGVRLVLADVEEEALAAALADLSEQKSDAITVKTDVADRESVFRLADHAHKAFSQVHILCNNAGVAAGTGRAVWEHDTSDWEWGLGVNLMGVVHGLQAFVPRMLAHGQEGYILNTASILGLTTGAGSIYGITKHALVRLTEGLHHDLRTRGSKLRAGVLCPGLVSTRILESDRNRPAHLAAREIPADFIQLVQQRRESAREHFKSHGMCPDQVGNFVVDAMSGDDFYLLTHPEHLPAVEQRLQGILKRRGPNPALRGPRAES